METIHGLDTIRGLVGEPPNIIKIDYKDLAHMQMSILTTNKSYIALIPYCFKCKEPLDWIRNGDIIFNCPRCHRNWVKGEGWNVQNKDSKGSGTAPQSNSSGQ